MVYDMETGGEPRHHRQPAMTKTQAISALILARVAEGATIKEAFEAVIGPGSFEQLAGEVWEAMQAA